MKVRVQEIDGKHRLVDDTTGCVAMNTRTGHALDGGGHAEIDPAMRQAGYMNSFYSKVEAAEARKRKT